MTTRDEAMRHSPAVWCLIWTGVGAAVILVGTVAWNVYDRRADVRRWLKM